MASEVMAPLFNPRAERGLCQQMKNVLCFPLFCKRCTQLNTKVAKLTTELKEEQEMNKCLRANQVLLQNKLKEEERVLKETCDQKDLQITEVQEQLRDVMFYLETQQKINHLPAETRQEIQEGQINIAMASASSPPSSGGSGKLSSRKGRSKRGK